MRTAAATFALVLLTACASAPPPATTSPAWSSVPPGVLDALCARLLDDGIGSSGSPILIVKTTQPIATAQAIAALGSMARGSARRERVTEALRAGQRAIPVELGGAGCTWRSVKSLDRDALADSMVVEISAPIANPYGRGEPGLFARVSLGGTNPSWYWIPMAESRGGWAIGRVLPLMM